MNADNQRAAVQELKTKTLQQIQIETAYKWAYRAWAAYRLSYDADAIEYEHEAIEHAALTGVDGVLDEVRLIIADGKHAI